MKQRITVEDLSELTDGQKERLREWWWGSNPGLFDVYALRFKYDDVTRYEGSYSLNGHRDFHEDYHTGEALPMLSIGQMIQLLHENKWFYELSFTEQDDMFPARWHYYTTSVGSYKDGEPCDLLWEGVKQVLSRSNRANEVIIS